MGFANNTPIRKNIRPAVFGDFKSREHVLPGGVKLDAATFPGDDAVRVRLTANAAQGATSLVVAALTGPIPDNAILDFGGAKLARVNDVSVDAPDTTITVDAIPTAMVTGDTTYYVEPGVGKRVAEATPVYISQATLESSAATGAKWKFAGPGVTVGAGDTVRLLAYDVQDVDDNNDADLARKGTLVFANFAYFSQLDASVQAKLRADYEVTVGPVGQEVPAT